MRGGFLFETWLIGCHNSEIEMLSKEFRIRKKEEVNLLFKTGRTVSSSEIALRFLPNNLNFTRIAVLVGVKLSKKAVVRNRIKRRLREVARLNFSKIPIGFDLLIIARKIKLREMEFGTLIELFLSLVTGLSNHKK